MTDDSLAELQESVTGVGRGNTFRRKPSMWVRALVSVMLLVTLMGCAVRPRPRALLPNVNIPLECASSIRLVGCDLSFNPPHCSKVAINYRQGCEQIVVSK
jgi:hypothetical protein